MHKKLSLISSLVTVALLTGCQPAQQAGPVKAEAKEGTTPTVANSDESRQKPVVYQVFTRLFGNQNTTNKPWGTVEENGVGKFSDFTPTALAGIKELGVSHVWYTGVPHHAVVADYQEFGISLDDPDVIKGRAGSPYAVKDYYNVNPDLANDPAKRMEEFEALIERTHQAGMKVIIDIVPNHVARRYESLTHPQENFGAKDNTDVEYARDNNFYYVVGETFKVPLAENGYQPLGGDAHPLADGEFAENPAKWTGNGARDAQPNINDWYETVKINYGVKPDGSYDFPKLPEEYAQKGLAEHHAFWQGKDLPDSWTKFEKITHFWLDKGVDGFRYDMAEMVPVEFWSFLNSSIKAKNPDAFLLAEVYNPTLYRDYLHLGKMDYLYDKVEFYDSLKLVMQGKGSTDALPKIQASMKDIESHMLHFLENHDEQRIASADFAGDAEQGKPALVASALISRSPTMLYFGQDVGEPGDGDAGFGKETRTTIFDYWGVPHHQRWMNQGQFDGGQLTDKEKALRQFHIDVMNISAFHPAMNGEYIDIHGFNREHSEAYSESVLSFMRDNDTRPLVVVSQFTEQAQNTTVLLPNSIAKLGNQAVELNDLLTGQKYQAVQHPQGLQIELALEPLQSVILEVQK